MRRLHRWEQLWMGVSMLAEIRLVVQLALGLVFMLSATGKLRDPKGFAHGVTDYQILPASLAYPVSILIIGLEGWLAIAHLTGWLLATAVPLACVTLASFALAVGVNLGRGRSLPCYCFGDRGGETISGRTLARLFSLFLCEALLLTAPHLLTTRPLVYQQLAAGELGLAFLWAMLLLVAGSWFLSLPDLIDMLRPCNACAARHTALDSRSARFSEGG